MNYLSLVLGSLVLVGLAAGCTEQKLLVAKGQLTYKGEPYKVPAKSGVTIVFTPVGPGGHTTCVATFHRDDATFTVAGPTGRGIAEGQYRISIDQMMMPPLPAEVQRMNTRFSAQKTKLIRDVKSADEVIVIDLGKAEG